MDIKTKNSTIVESPKTTQNNETVSLKNTHLPKAISTIGPEIFLHPWDPQQNLTNTEYLYIQTETNTVGEVVQAVPNFRPRKPKSFEEHNNVEETSKNPEKETASYLMSNCEEG